MNHLLDGSDRWTSTDFGTSVIIAMSEMTRSALLSLGISNVRVIHYGVDTGICRPSSKVEARSTLEIREDPGYYWASSER